MGTRRLNALIGWKLEHLTGTVDETGDVKSQLRDQHKRLSGPHVTLRVKSVRSAKL